jgi:hypothetical protein
VGADGGGQRLEGLFLDHHGLLLVPARKVEAGELEKQRSPPGGSQDVGRVRGRKSALAGADEGPGTGTGGAAGQGIGGGIYIEPTACVAISLTSIISGNHASASDDDIFGTYSVF